MKDIDKKRDAVRKLLQGKGAIICNLPVKQKKALFPLPFYHHDNPTKRYFLEYGDFKQLFQELCHESGIKDNPWLRFFEHEKQEEQKKRPKMDDVKKLLYNRGCSWQD